MFATPDTRAPPLPPLAPTPPLSTLQSITKEGLSLPGEGKDAKRLAAHYADTFAPLSAYLKKVYGDKVEKVVVSSRLTDTPCVLVTSTYGYSANMQRLNAVSEARARLRSRMR